jgi:S-adenosyl-L-methionine hydrolase (adenosine-forming)
LSRGVSLQRLGRELKDFVRLPWPKPKERGGTICGKVVYIDRFGNAISNIAAEFVSGERKATCEVIGKRKVRCVWAEFYGAVPVNSPLAIMGSGAFLEIAVNGGSAARRFGLKPGNPVIVRMN